VSGYSSIRSGIFAREHERKQLSALLKRDPTCMHVIVGPCNCGKKAFMQSYAQEHTLCYIDLRAVDAATPEGMASALV
jgi:predicted AAA+ superfamily ATPase